MHPDDLPQGQGLIPVPDEDAAVAGAMADLGDLQDPRNPMSTAVLFYQAVTASGGPDVALLERLVVPGTGPWDFDTIHDFIGDRSLATRADPPSTGENWVRYAKLVDTAKGSPNYRADTDILVSGLIISLQWWPDPGVWLVYGVGDYVRPEQMRPAGT